MAEKVEYDLIVHDAICESLAQEYIKLGDELEGYLDEYKGILQRLINDGIKEGKVHDNLVRFIEAVELLKGESKEMASKAKECASEFLVDMDTADNYLY